MLTLSAPLLLLLLLLLLPPPAPADLSGQYHNYFDTTTICGMSPLNLRVNNSFLPFSRAVPYIINGNDAYYGEWPFVAWVQFYFGRCSGVIVSSEVVVTTGHCLEGLKNKEWDPKIKTELNPEIEAHVTVGKISFRSRDEFEARYDIKAVQEGAYYRQRGFLGSHPDFARLWLRKPIEWNDYVQPVCIPSKPETIYTLAAGPVFFIGNGVRYQTQEPRYPKVMQWIQMISDDPTFLERQNGNKENDTNMYFTTHDDTYKITCPGDSGGPLVALDGNKRWSLVGISKENRGLCDPDPQGVRDIFVLMAKIVGIFDKDFVIPGPEQPDLEQPDLEQPDLEHPVEHR